MSAGFDVQKVARLAALGLEPGEEERLAREFTAILAFVDQVRRLPLDGVPAAVHGIAPPLGVEADEPRPGLRPEEALARAPDSDQGHFRVPPILESGAD